MGLSFFFNIILNKLLDIKYQLLNIRYPLYKQMKNPNFIQGRIIPAATVAAVPHRLSQPAPGHDRFVSDLCSSFADTPTWDPVPP